MHTFFINTSGKELRSCAEIFEIQHETRRLVSLDCPLAKWNDAEQGYKACVTKMGDLIDSYKDINNDFNLILYIDLLAYEKYTSIPMSEHRRRHACLKALRSILKHYIGGTFVKAMDDCGRMPREVLLIFEENQLPEDCEERSDDAKEMMRSYVQAFLGVPDAAKLNALIGVGDNNTENPEFTPEKFCEIARTKFNSCVGESVMDTYLHEVGIFVSEIQGCDTIEPYMEKLFNRVLLCADVDDRSIASVSFVTNRRAGIANKQQRTRRDLRLCFYVLRCVNDETVYEKNDSQWDSDRGTVKAFTDVDWNAVALALAEKQAIFRKKHQETQRLSESFTEMKLAPPLYAFDYERFAMDEYGNRNKVFDVIDVEGEEQPQEDQEQQQSVIRPKDQKAVVVSDVEGTSLFDQDEYPLFDYTGDPASEDFLSSKTTPEQYIAEAQKLRKHHLDYLQRLRVHVSDRLSNYAGRSSENEPALLRKRKVSIAEEDFEDTGRDYRYAKTSRPLETRKLKTVETISETAFSSAMIDYMEFCAGRSVAVTDIEEQCNWFVTRITQIKKSLQKIKAVAIGLLISLLVLYIPFVVLQWSAIVENALTVAVALGSICVPIVLLLVIFGIMTAVQRKKYRDTWKEFKEKSDEVLRENALAAEKYDRLLSVFVPTLRWVYEYKLDVEFYAECCKMARAKVGHHMQKLHDRVVAVGNIIEDLEVDPEVLERFGRGADIKAGNELDYNLSFCTGNTNRAFYSIVDNAFLASILK